MPLRHDSRRTPVTAKLSCSRATRDLRAERQRIERRQLDRRARETRRSAAPRPCGSALRRARAAPPPAASRHSRRTRAGPRPSLLRRFRRPSRARRAAPRSAASRRATARRAPARCRRSPPARVPSTKRAASTLPRRCAAARSGRAGVMRGSKLTGSAFRQRHHGQLRIGGRECRPPAGRAPCARYWRRAPARSSCRWRASGSSTAGRSRSRW